MSLFSRIKNSLTQGLQESRAAGDIMKMEKENAYSVQAAVLKPLKTASLPAVQRFIDDFADISPMPTMTQLIYLLSGESGKSLYPADPRLKQAVSNHLMPNQAGGYSGQTEEIVDALKAYANETRHNPETVENEFRLRSAGTQKTIRRKR